MIKEKAALRPGLYLIPTPLGNLGDITLRAVEYLKAMDVLACEDTRTTRKLLGHLAIEAGDLVPYHDHNGEKIRPKILQWLRDGKRIGLVSDAGTPLISDPGFKLVRAVREEGLFLTSLPGPSSVITALTLSGFPTDRFFFGGFVQHARDLADLARLPCTFIFFSTPTKLIKDLGTLHNHYPHRHVAVVREISKLFEEVQYGTFHDVTEHYASHPARGEIVIVVSPPTKDPEIAWDEVDRDIERLLPTMRAKDLSEHLAGVFSIPKRELYQRIVSKKEGE